MTYKILFRQSEVADPYAVYRQRLQEMPVCFDAAAGIWAVHTSLSAVASINVQRSAFQQIWRRKP
ncbi:hypothetical protein [Chitinophaga filiformis]|uniref:Uncharacterized protein n=1 Tax=Chitinophaga filiformis TaxID=104663 RepID=A0ABY4I108_CHIFI|nr:hypothetical protein [Chitinophaga filiformis]UPK69772.1 hypothetical protein MYF79_00525 [Chitinophaga filiformis]